MQKIQLLSQHTINKIAAGEVVESPKSVVKELVENAIDAGATAITVEAKEGGIAYLRISDNGCGIPKEQVETAFLRHATNKMREIEDLENVFTLGFRGEALASIAAVAHVEMTTKTAEETTGTHIMISAGVISVKEDVACKDGTTIIVRDLFYNVPARKKFLKKPSIEGGYISDTMQKMALGHPEISFCFINNATTMLHTSGNNDPKASVFYVYGKDAANSMIPLAYEKGDYHLQGLIGKPELSRGNRNYENLFINGRFIKNSIVSGAVEDAYKTRMMVGKFPVFVLNLSISPALVDVNVHPAKLEVRFRNDNEVYEFFYQAILKTFENQVLIPKVSMEKPEKTAVQTVQQSLDDLPWEEETSKKQEEHQSVSYLEEEKDLTNRQGIRSVDELLKKDTFSPFMRQEKVSYNTVMKTEEKEDVTKSFSDGNMLKEGKKPVVSNQAEENSKDLSLQLDETPVKQKKPQFFQHYRIVGQVFATYWIVEQQEKIYLIDQHAAHERVLYEKLMHQFRQEHVVAQKLLTPFMLRLNSLECAILEENKALLESFGFEITQFGKESYALTAVPCLMQEPSDTSFFISLIDHLGEGKVRDLYEEKLLSVATMACKAAVKAHDKLSFQEATALLDELLKLENPFTCPHGRPTIVEITRYELEKLFKRIQD